MKISVLLVDDDPAVLRAVARALRGDMDVYTAEDADEAIAFLAKNAVDVIVSDVDMPGISGLELLSFVRREHPAIVRVLITGAATAARAIDAINEGEVARFFVKPFNLGALRETLFSFRERIDRVRKEAVERTERVRAKGLRDWAERAFPGVTEIPRDAEGAMLVDRAAYPLVFRRT